MSRIRVKENPRPVQALIALNAVVVVPAVILVCLNDREYLASGLLGVFLVCVAYLVVRNLMIPWAERSKYRKESWVFAITQSVCVGVLFWKYHAKEGAFAVGDFLLCLVCGFAFYLAYLGIVGKWISMGVDAMLMSVRRFADEDDECAEWE